MLLDSNYVTHVIDRKTAILMKLEVYAITLNSFLTGLTDLADGTLSPHLIPPHILASTLQKVHKLIYDHHPGYSLVHTNTTFYYNHYLSSFTCTKSHILIHIQAPFSRIDALFDLYQVSSFPSPSKQTIPPTKATQSFQACLTS